MFDKNASDGETIDMLSGLIAVIDKSVGTMEAKIELLDSITDKVYDPKNEEYFTQKKVIDKLQGLIAEVECNISDLLETRNKLAKLYNKMEKPV